jgi:hypothetical protein
MPAKEIKELRKAGKLDEAYALARSEYTNEPDNIWTKRNLSWVLYDQLCIANCNHEQFLLKLNEVIGLQMLESEDLFWESMPLAFYKFFKPLNPSSAGDFNLAYEFFIKLQQIPVKRKTKWYSLLLRSLVRMFKDSPKYLEVIDWWGFENFMPEDFEQVKLADGTAIMALAEQVYIHYAKHLLRNLEDMATANSNSERAIQFVAELAELMKIAPNFQYPIYYRSLLLGALNKHEEALAALIPFALRKKSDFWVWSLMAELVPNNPELRFSCYCKALCCTAPDVMLLKVKQVMVALLLERGKHAEAKHEIIRIVEVRSASGYTIPGEVLTWQAAPWYSATKSSVNNAAFYRDNSQLAEGLLYSNFPLTTVVVQNVQDHKKIVSFYSLDKVMGTCKYDRFVKHLSVGDILSVRIHHRSAEGYCKLLTLEKVKDIDTFKKVTKQITGVVSVPAGKNFGFIEDCYLDPSILNRIQLENGSLFNGTALQVFDVKKRSWGWRVISGKKSS